MNGPRIILLGPPGSGKGTQGRRLAEALGVEHVSTGDLLRATLQTGDPFGVASVMAAGGLVADAILERLLTERLPPAMVLDGYPRTAAQAAALDRLLAPDGPSHVLELVVPEDVLLSRLLGRAREGDRPDDTAAIIAARFEVYRNEIEDLRRHYGARLRRVDGVGSLDEVAGRLLDDVRGSD
ncbi:MAG TPA: nucleoside monophosphate kinase [Actinomycetota bacterium]|nr:nucleoside monophosphate kinase [Actinomycetota bacterium]